MTKGVIFNEPSFVAFFPRALLLGGNKEITLDHSGWKLVKKSHFQSFEFWRQKIKIFGNLIIFGVKIQMRLLGWFLNTVHCFLHTKIVDDHMFIEIGTELLFFADQQKKRWIIISRFVCMQTTRQFSISVMREREVVCVD